MLNHSKLFVQEVTKELLLAWPSDLTISATQHRQREITKIQD